MDLDRLAQISRRRLLGGTAGLVGSLALTNRIGAQDATPVNGEWTSTDVLGTTVTLPERPVRIAANLATAAALWDLGIESVAVFDWTASSFPDGDHIAWGNIDPFAVVNVGDIDGNILPEELLNTEPDIILTLTYDRDDPSQTAGVPPELASQINAIAPVLVVTDMDSTAIQLERLLELGSALGANLDDPEIVTAKATYEAKVEEFQQVAEEKADLSALFASFDPDAFYVGGPDGVAELQFLSSLGLKFANVDSPEAGEFWETLSREQAGIYPGDVIYSDVYSVFKTIEELQGEAVYSEMPAVKAGQVGLWNRDFPVTYAGITDFLETILVTLRDAKPVITSS